MDRFLLITFLCVNWLHLAFSQALPWTYLPNALRGPANWAGICSTGKRQSPIDIKSSETTLDKSLGAFTLKNYDRILNKTFTGSNNGHSLGMQFPAGVYNVSGGGLKDVYTTVQFHFHFGPNNTVGSEHIVDGEHYAAELHFVSYNTKYADILDALNHEDGLAVLGLFIQVGGKNNTAFSFLETARNLTSSYTTISDVPAFRFDTILPANKTKYFRYSGSLTTPSCTESVTWTVFRDAVNISRYQMNLLRQLRKTYTTTSVGNFRPVQPLYDRVIRSSFQVAEMINTTSTPVSTDGTGTTTSTITEKKVSSSVPSTGATTNAEESPPAPTVEFDLGSSAVPMTGGLGLAMLFTVLTALFVH